MKRIDGFDGVRAVSVILVILSHVAVWPRLGVDNPAVLSILSPTNGVNMFFALSGFLITLLLLEERARTGTTDLRAFFMRRALRIFPLYFLAIAFVLAMDAGGYASVNNCIYPYAFTYTINFAPKECAYQSLSHLWSLAVEEHFYLVWPFISLLGRKVAIAAALLFAAGCLYFGIGIFPFDPQEWRLVSWTFPAAVPIAFGCIAAFFCRTRLADLVCADRSGVLVLAIAAGLLSPAFMQGKLAWLLAVAAMLIYIYRNQDSLLVRFLEWRPLVAIGVMSYGLYVWHGVFTGNGPYRANSLPFPPEMDTGLWISLIVDPLSYLLFEKPIMRLKKRYERV